MLPDLSQMALALIVYGFAWFLFGCFATALMLPLNRKPGVHRKVEQTPSSRRSVRKRPKERGWSM